MAKRVKKNSAEIQQSTTMKTIYDDRTANAAKNSGAYAFPWWKYDAAQLPSKVFEACSQYKNYWAFNYQDLVGHFLTYSDRKYTNIYGNAPYIKVVGNQYLTLNIVASVVDTLVSKITTQLPSVTYLTQNADFKLQREAQLLQKFTQGYFQHKGLDRITPMTFKDSCISGTGMIHIRKHNLKKELVYETVKAYELIFDWNSGVYPEKPLSNFHVVKFVSRYSLIMEYPEHKEKLLQTAVTNEILTTATFNTDNILVLYSYDFYSKRHTVCVRNAVLEDMEWNYKDENNDPLFPLAVMRYTYDDRGWFGIGIGEKLKALNNELNYLLQTAQLASRTLAIPKIFVSRSADIVIPHLDDSMAGIIQFSGGRDNAPFCAPLGTVPTDLFTQIQNFIKWGYEECGMSQLSASSQVPTGIDSGRGLEVMYHIESSRFAEISRSWEDLYIQLNSKTLSMLEQTPELSKKALVQTYYSQAEGEEVNFREIDLSRDQCYIKTFPISALPNTPEGQYNIVEKWMASGFIDPMNAKKLIQIPDTENYLDFANAEYEFILKQISKMVRGEPQIPSPMLKMPMALEIAQQAYFLFSNKGLAETELGYIEEYITTCKDAVDEQMAQMAAQQQGAQNVPGSPSTGGEPASSPNPVSGSNLPIPAQAGGGTPTS